MSFFSRAALVSLLCIGVTLPQLTLAVDSTGGRCFCELHIEYISLSEGYDPDDMTEDKTVELGPTYATTNEENCPAACTQYADDEDGITKRITVTGSDYSYPSEEAARAAAVTEAVEKARDYIQPNLNVSIPGLTFSDILNENGILKINFLPEYLNGLYRYALGAAAIVAVIMIMIGGAQYILGSGLGSIEAGKKRITNAVTGLVLVLGAYTMLVLVNPSLVTFAGVELEYIKPDPWIVAEATEAVSGSGCQSVKGLVASCTKQELASSKWSSEVTASINAIAKAKNVDPILLATHLEKEGGVSRINNWTTRIGPCGEIGPAQFMPTTFDGIVKPSTRCCTKIARKNGIKERDRTACTSTTDTWPPPSSEFPNCNSEICGNCQVPDQSCRDYFDTTKNAEAFEDAVKAQAQLIKMNLTYVTGDLASAMCAYNGGVNSTSSAAATYARSAATIYASTCAASGGSN